MSSMGIINSERPEFDQLLSQIAEYTVNKKINSPLAYETARYCFMDSIGCALLALKFPACTKNLGPIVPGAILQNGARVPGTNYELDPVRAAFNIGTMVRWLDFNDTWLAAEWGHPSDNLGAILGVSDYLARQGHSFSMKDVLTAMIKAHEIQGILALNHSLNQVGLDHVFFVKIASTAIATALLGGTFEQVKSALSQAWVDGASLRTYRHAPNTGSRKSWAAGDASSRGVQLALLTLKGEIGYPSALTAKNWGFQDTLFKGKTIELCQELDCYVMENILFKISYPAEFHAQTAVEAAIQLHQEIKDKLDNIAEIKLETQQSGYRIINKTGPLNNPADRDHCLQYMVAIGLIFGELKAEHYEEDIAKNPLIDLLREKMSCRENEVFSKEYLAPDKRSIANAIQILFKDGSATEKITIDYPVGHRQRRSEGIPLLKNKFLENISHGLSSVKAKKFSDLCSEQHLFEQSSLTHIMNVLAMEETK